MSEEKYSTNLLKTKYVNDSKITDHYAIIPTGQGYENYDALPQLQKRCLQSNSKRFLAIFYPPAEFNKISVTIDVEGEQFTASGKVCINSGYQEVLKEEKRQEKSTIESKNSLEEKVKNEEEQESKDRIDEGQNLEILNKLKKGKS